MAIMNTINTDIGTFVNLVAQKYDLDSDELLLMWTNRQDPLQCQPALPKTLPKTLPKAPPKAPPKTLPVVDDDSISVDSTREGCCPYTFTKGANSGQECGSKPQGGNTYCSKHKKYEGQEPVKQKVLPKSKKSIVPAVKPTQPTKQNTVLVLKINRNIDRLWHVETAMVFESATKRTVIGKCVGDKIIPLTPEDIDICKAHGFQFEAPKVKELDGTVATTVKKTVNNLLTQTKGVEDILRTIQTEDLDDDDDDENSDLFGDNPKDLEEEEEDLFGDDPKELEDLKEEEEYLDEEEEEEDEDED